MVVLEGDRASVVGEGVDLDYEALGAPKEIDLVAAELDVGLGGREVVVGAESEEVFLEVGALAFALYPFQVDSFELGLTLRATQEVRGNGAVEVVHGALDGGDGDAVAVGKETTFCERGASMQVDTATRTSFLLGRDGDVDGAVEWT